MSPDDILASRFLSGRLDASKLCPSPEDDSWLAGLPPEQFLDNSSALLERMEGSKYSRLAEGTAAEDQARTLFTQNPPGKGLARTENWGLAQSLWAPQGNLMLAHFRATWSRIFDPCCKPANRACNGHARRRKNRPTERVGA